MKYLPIILLFILTSCVTEKRCLIKFPPDTTTTIETTHDFFFTTDTVEVKIEGDTAYVESAWNDNVVWNNLPEGSIPPDITVEHNISPIRADVPLAYSTAWVEKNVLKMELIQRDSILWFKIDSAKQYAIDSIKISNTKIVEVEVVPKWANTYKVIAWFCIGLIVLGFILLLIFIKMK